MKKFRNLLEGLVDRKQPKQVVESDKNWSDTLQKIARERQLKSLSKKDRETLEKIAAMMAKANESVKEDNIHEGTWAVPDSHEKLVKLQNDVLSKPHRANTVKDVDNFIKKVYSLFGDDGFFDMLDLVKDIIQGKKLDDYLSTKALKLKLGKGMDLNLLLQRELTRWTNGTMTFKGNKIDTVPGSWMDKESQDEAMQRGRGNIKMKMDKKVKFEESIDLGEASARADAMKAIKRDKDFQRVKDVDIKATADDMKLAKKNPIVQLRKILDYKGGTMEFMNKKTLRLKADDADALLRGFDALQKVQDKERYQALISKDPDSLKKILQIVKR